MVCPTMQTKNKMAWKVLMMDKIKFIEMEINTFQSNLNIIDLQQFSVWVERKINILTFKKFF